jgi:hypothetical protein
MKSFLIILLTVCYSSVTAGFSLQKHFCMGRLAEVSWHTSPADKPCPLCGMEEKGDCCEDEAHFYKISTDQQVSDYVAHACTPVVSDAWFPAVFSWMEPVVVRFDSKVSHPFTGPPIHRNNPIYLINCSYLI